ncbi:MAG TPA: acetate--CoA ligase [bacterium]|nr:acetate--CoA ligase [bacterium]
MSAAVIRKQRSSDAPPPNLSDYEKVCRRFTWEAARAELAGLPGGAGLNMAHEAVTRHIAEGHGDRIALEWVDAVGAVHPTTYAQLEALSNRFANALAALGEPPGTRVFSLLGRIPALYATALGTLKARSVYAPLFAAFGPEPVRARLNKGEGRVLVTTLPLYQRRIAAQRDALPGLRHVLLADVAADATVPPGTASLASLLERVPDTYRIGPTEPETPALLHFTSGTTGMPKAAVLVHDAIVTQRVTARLALDLHAGERYWCTADPGWVTGSVYGILAPLALGATVVVDAAEFDAERWYRILAERDVAVWYTAPTAVRLLMKLGTALARQHRYPALRFLASVGEPLNPEAVCWGEEAFGLPFHDNWWQTETGAIMIANFAAMDIRPGSMGRPVPGIAAEVLASGEGPPRPVAVETLGELALRTPWPSLFRGYLGEEARYRKRFQDGWYRTGDLVRRDADGYYWFVGRADDVIKSAGHLIGPFEVERALTSHPAVVEAGAIGKPDPVSGEVVKAFVLLRDGYEPNEALRRELLAHARTRLGVAVAPKEIEFRTTLPRTRSGKIMRRLLKAQELGLPEGDISTLETAPGSDRP